MVKSSSCGFENSAVDVCAKCGSGIQRYIKALRLRTFDDLSAIKEDLDSGNVLIVNLIPFPSGKEKMKHLENLRKAVLDLQRHVLSAGGDAGRIGDERLVLAPSPFKIWRPKLQPSKPHSKREQEFRKCPYCGVTIKVSNIDMHVEKIHGVPTWLEEGIPSIGTLARFLARNFGQVSVWLAEAEKSGVIDEVKEAISSYLEPGVFADRAMETGRFREILLAVDRLKNEAGGEEVRLWVLETELSILCSWKPGFEEYLAELFFTEERCRDCKRKDKVQSRCKEGLSSCVFDGEFEQFEEESVRKIVEHLKDGVEPKEFEVPRHLQEQGVKLKNLCQAAAKKSN